VSGSRGPTWCGRSAEASGVRCRASWRGSCSAKSESTEACANSPRPRHPSTKASRPCCQTLTASVCPVPVTQRRGPRGQVSGCWRYPGRSIGRRHARRRSPLRPSRPGCARSTCNAIRPLAPLARSTSSANVFGFAEPERTREPRPLRGRASTRLDPVSATRSPPLPTPSRHGSVQSGSEERRGKLRRGDEGRQSVARGHGLGDRVGTAGSSLLGVRAAAHRAWTGGSTRTDGHDVVVHVLGPASTTSSRR